MFLLVCSLERQVVCRVYARVSGDKTAETNLRRNMLKYTERNIEGKFSSRFDVHTGCVRALRGSEYILSRRIVTFRLPPNVFTTGTR